MTAQEHYDGQYGRWMEMREMRDGFEFDAILYPYYKKDAIRITDEHRALEDYQAYINAHGIEQAEIIMPDLEILKRCPTLKYLRIIPYNAPDDLDLSPIYELPEVKELYCYNRYGEDGKYFREVDYLRVPGLISINFEANRGTLNYNRVETLRSVHAGGFRGKNRDLTDLFCSTEVDTLSLIQCGMNSLNGIETSRKMQCVYLHYNRCLNDISALGKVKETLRALRIENCPQIKDFSVLGELEQLELLQLMGSNVLPSLDFLKRMKNLKTFVFSVNVLDGDLSPCLGLSYVYSAKDRRHYNLKDADMPRGKCFRGNENIEEWRRLE